MLNHIKISFRDSLIYGLGNIAVKLIGFVLIPLYTNPKYFNVDDYGMLGVLDISGMVLTAFLASSLPQILTRWYWDKDYQSNQRGIFFMTLATQIVISLLFCLLLFPLSGTFSELLFKKTDWGRVITLVVLSSGIQAVNNIVNTLIRLQSKSLLYTVTNLSKLAIVLVLTIWLIVSKGKGLEGIYLAQVIGNTFFLIVLAVYTIRNCTLYFNWPVFKSMQGYGFPLLLANISAVLLNVIDRFSLNSLALLKYVALYTLAFKISSVLKLVIVDSFKMAIAPLMIKNIDSPDNSRFYSKILLYTSYVLMLAIIVVSMFSLEIIKVITKSSEFWNSVSIIPILALSVFFVNMKEVTVYGLHIARKTGIIGIIVILATVLSLALNVALIPRWDITGAALATLISQFVYWLAVHYFSQKSFYVPYEMKKILILFISGGIFSFLSLLFNQMELLPRLLMKSLTVISFPFVLYLLNFYEKAELQALKGFFVKWSDISKFGENIKSIKTWK